MYAANGSQKLRLRASDEHQLLVVEDQGEDGQWNEIPALDGQTLMESLIKGEALQRTGGERPAGPFREAR